MASWHHRSALGLIILSASTLLILSTASAGSAKRLIIRHDSASLAPDYEKGRFGTGRLYFDDPYDITVTEDLDVYILDSGNYRIQVMSERGRFIGQWGSKGDLGGQFDEPVALDINPDNDFLVVLDQGNFQVHKFDLKGEFLLSFGQEGVREGKFEEPVDLAVDTKDFIYVVDRERRLVIKFHRSGAFVKEWGARGPKDERLADPVSIAYSDYLTGFIYVLDLGKKALVKYKREGDLVEIIPLAPDILQEGSKPVKIQSNSENDLFLLDAGLGKLIKFERYGVSVFQLESADLSLVELKGLALDEEDRVYLTDIKKNRIFRYPLEIN